MYQYSIFKIQIQYGNLSLKPSKVNLPSVIFGVQQEISANNGDTNCHNDENHEDEQHESVDVVDFICPKRSENEVPKRARKFNIIHSQIVHSWISMQVAFPCGFQLEKNIKLN